MADQLEVFEASLDKTETSTQTDNDVVTQSMDSQQLDSILAEIAAIKDEMAAKSMLIRYLVETTRVSHEAQPAA